MSATAGAAGGTMLPLYFGDEPAACAGIVLRKLTRKLAPLG